jgi:hypothetical protein
MPPPKAVEVSPEVLAARCVYIQPFLCFRCKAAQRLPQPLFFFLTPPLPNPPLYGSEKLKARFGNVETKIGGKGTTHRPAKTASKASAVDEKKLQAGLKKLAMNTVPSIETVQVIKSDGSVVQLSSPKGSCGEREGGGEGHVGP